MPGVFPLNPFGVIPQSGDGIAFGVVDGSAIPAFTPGILTLVSDGTNARYLKGDTSGRLVVVGAGVAGTPAGGVLTIQGDPAGTPVLVVGGKTNNAAAPGANNLGTLTVLANAAAPTWTEGNLVLLSALLNGSLRTDNTSWLGSTAPTVGQKTMVNSVPVTIASDQTAIPVTIATPTGTNFVVWGDQLPGGTAVTPLERTTYTEQYANFQGSVGSNNAADSAAGAGARTVKITYFDAAGAGPFTETVTLNGVTPVNLVNLNHCYIEKIEVATVGTRYGSNTGIISLYTGLAGAGTVVGTIAATNSVTYWAHHYVPIGKICYVKDVTLGTAANKGGSFWVTEGNPLVTTDPEHQITPTFRTAQSTPLSIYPFTIPVITTTGFIRLRMYVQADSGGTPNTYYGSFTLNEVSA
jgi:hypothetical protein